MAWQKCKYLQIKGDYLAWDKEAWDKAAIPFVTLPDSDGKALVEAVEYAMKEGLKIAQGAHDRYLTWCVMKGRHQQSVGLGKAAAKAIAGAAGAAPAAAVVDDSDGFFGVSGVLAWTRGDEEEVKQGSNPLLDAALVGDVAKVKSNAGGLEAKDASGQTALSKAAAAGQLDVVRALIAQKANVNTTDKYSRSAAQWAVYEGNVTVAQELVNAGATLDNTAKSFLARKTWPEEARFIASARAGNDDDAAVTAALAKNKGLLNAVDTYGQTALIKASIAGNVNVVKALLKAGANAAVADKYGLTAKAWAVEQGRANIAGLL